MTTTSDPLAHASETPDVSALIEEFTYSQNSGPCQAAFIGLAEDTRYNRVAGKSNPPDGCRWQKNAPSGVIVRPYDGRPDCDVQLTDEIILAEVDMLMASLAMAQVGATTTHTTKLTAANIAELRAVAEWVRRVTALDLTDDGELLAQMTSQLGWSVLNPGWLERWELVERTVTLEEFVAAVVAQTGPEAAASVQAAILDPTLEELAVNTVREVYPHLPKARAKQIVKDFQAEGAATFMDRQLAEKRPTLRTLIQGYNYFVSGSAGKISKARGHLVVERFFQADLEATAAAAGWNPEFVAAVIGTAGLYSVYGEAQRDKQVAMEQDATDKSIEIWTTSVLQFDETTGAAGVYCTTFSPHLQPGRDQNGAEASAFYAHHYLLAYAHGKPPFVQTRREVIGPSLDDSRGVPDMTRSDQKVIKNLQDAQVARAHLEVNPPRVFLGFGGSKVSDWNAPGAKIDSMMPGADVKDLGPSKGNPQYAELAINRVDAGTRRRFALPNTSDGSHPSGWQLRQLRLTTRWLAAWAEAYWQLCVLTYQELDEQELAAIIGRWPDLTVDDLLRHRVTLTFDPRGLDNDWRKQTLDTMVQLLQVDKGGLMDTGMLVQLIGNYTDPTIMSAIVRDPAGASAALYRKVQNDINDIILGNPPPMVEMDATAGMQLKMAFQVIGQNEDYQRILQQDPKRQENLKTYIKNLQHSQQETQLSPQQGRLGVSQMPERPVQQGAMMGMGEE